jgi:hypothetical protein
MEHKQAMAMMCAMHMMHDVLYIGAPQGQPIGGGC